MKIRSQELEQASRIRLGLPEHFCSPSICAHALKLLTEAPPLKERKWYLSVISAGQSEVWNLTSEKSYVVFKNGGTRTRVSEYQMKAEEVRKLVNRESSLWVTLSFESAYQVKALRKTLRLFLDEAK